MMWAPQGRLKERETEREKQVGYAMGRFRLTQTVILV